jgi:hypothetical protein
MMYTPPTLTGLGASSHRLHELNRILLDTHVKDITNTLFYEDLSGVVLVVIVMEVWLSQEWQPSSHIDSLI